jgi:hypothetical protein
MSTALTFGIDLAQPRRTGACLIEMGIRRAWCGAALGYGSLDAQLLDLMPEVTRVGIDAPVGWPREFLEAISSFHDRG